MLERFPGIYEITVDESEGSANTIQLYLVKGNPGQRSLLVDAGYSSQWCQGHLLAELEALGVSPRDLDVFITHKHADHCGMAHALQQWGASIFMNREEERHQYDCLYYRKDHSNENAQLRVLRRNGITPELAPLIWEKFMEVNRNLNGPHAIWMMILDPFDYENIQPGQVFSYGPYQLEAIALRGHTYGQMGLVDRNHKIFFAADQVLNRTVPIVGTSYADEHLLQAYTESVRALAAEFSDYTILPAHEGPIEDLAGTVQRVLAAYEKKVAQVLDQVSAEQEQTVWQIGKHVYGLTPAKRSDAAFYHSKFITTKTFSMLEYLYDTGRIHRREENGTLYWSK